MKPGTGSNRERNESTSACCRSAKAIRRGFGPGIATGERRGQPALELAHLLRGGFRLLGGQLRLLQRDECGGGLLVIARFDGRLGGGQLSVRGNIGSGGLGGWLRRRLRRFGRHRRLRRSCGLGGLLTASGN